MPALGQSLQKSFATRWAPVGGLLFWGFLSCPLSRKPAQKRFLPLIGGSFLTEDVFEKSFQVPERVPLSAIVPAHMAAPLSESSARAGGIVVTRTLPAPG
jgi:hypothetical protein